MKKKRTLLCMITALLLAVSLPLGRISTFATSSGIVSGTNGQLTRAEWIHNLVYTFDMTVESDELPDNYFTDVAEDHEFYEDLLLAVEFGVIHVEAGQPLEPDKPVTRDFAASTLNYCLGYQLEEGKEYSFPDSVDCSDPDSAQIAVDRGWITLENGAFLPSKVLTDAEAERMLDDAAEIMDNSIIDENFENTYEFASGVIEIPQGTVVETTENGIAITDCPKTIKEGDTFAVYFGDLVNVYVASKVSVTGDTTTITTETAATEDAFENIEAEGIMDADAMEIIPEEGVEISMEEEGISTYGPSRTTKKLKNIKATKDLKLTDGVTAKVTVHIRNPKVEYSINANRAYVTLKGETQIDYGVDVDLLKAADVNRSVRLFICNVAGVGSFDVMVNFDLEGAMTGTVKGQLTAGVECQKGDAIRLVKSFKQTDYHLNANLNGNVGLYASLGVTQLPVVTASIYAEVGAHADFRADEYSTGTPKVCMGFRAYLYAKIGAVASADFGVWSDSIRKEYDLFDVDNSPVRIMRHYEDGRQVSVCTRGETSNFFTRYNSRWSSSGWGDGAKTITDGGYGLDAQGNRLPLYEYETGEEGIIITKYNGYDAYVVIPSTLDGETVVAIGTNAFSENTSLKGVVIPDCVTEIEAWAFGDCINLRDVTLSMSLKTLSGSSFQRTAISNIHIPKSLESCDLTGGPFTECNNLKTVTFEEGVTKIVNNLFGYCTGLEQITIPDTVTVIEQSAFDSCTNLSSVALGNSVTEIDAWAFRDCSSLENIELPKSLKKMESSVFTRTALNSIHIPKSLESCDLTGGPFTECNNLKTVTFEEGITKIANNLFEYCTGLEQITIPDTVTVIEQSAFDSCTNLSSVIIGNAVKEIESLAFYNCSNLSSVTFGKNVETIGFLAFSKCSNLKTLKIPDSVTEIEDSAFSECSGLTTVNIPSGMTCLEGGVFGLCTSLQTITIPTAIVEIESQAFIGCTSLESVLFSADSSLESIGSNAFLDCTLLKTIDIPSRVQRIYGGAFENCTSLSKVTLPKTLDSLGYETFTGCQNLKDVTFSDYSITEIEGATFKDCSSLAKIILPKGLEIIGENAFLNDTSLTEVVIPESVTTIDNSAFSYPERTTIYGKAGSYAETFAGENGFKFVNDKIEIEGIILKGGVENINMTVGEKYHAEFEIYPEDGNEMIILADSEEILEFKGHTIHAQYSGDTVVTASTSSGLTYTFNVHVREADYLEILKEPTKTTYNVGEKFDPTGLTVQVVYDDETTEVVTDYTITDFDSSEEGICYVTVNWETLSGWSMRESFEVNIVDNRPKLTGISIVSQPNKTQYALRERLDLTGLVVKAEYSDGSSKTITDYTYSGYNMLKEGKQQITVTYGEMKTTFYVVVGEVDNVTAMDPPSGLKLSTIASSGKPKLTWDKVEGADKYEIWRKVGSSGTYKKYDTTTGTSYTNSSTTPGTVYYYKIKAIDTDNETRNSDYSAEKYITCDLAQPTNMKITPVTETGKPRVTWDKVDGASKYEVWRKVGSSGTYKKYDTTTGTSYTNSSTTPGTIYYYKVKAVCGANSGGNSAFSKEVCMARDLPQPANVKIAPVTSTGKPKVTWDKVDGASKYEVWRKVGSSGTYKKYDTTTGTSYTNSSTTPGTIYYYKVKAVCGTNSGGNSAFSKAVSMARDLPQPTGVKLTTVASSGKPKLTWNKVDGASKYEVWRKVGSSGTYKKYDTTTGTSYTNRSTTPGTVYYYKVKAVCGANSGGNSAFSASDYVTCDLAAPKITVSGTKKPGKIVVSWSKVAGADRYYIYRATRKNGTYSKYDSTTGTTYTNSSVTKGKYYYYKVKAVYDGKSAANSAYSNMGYAYVR